MHPLDRKLLRHLWRLRAQVLAVALVMAGGAATVVPTLGAYRSLEETRNAYCERQRFAEAFATLERAPASVASRIPGMQAVEARIAESGLPGLHDMQAPATGLFALAPAPVTGLRVLVIANSAIIILFAFSPLKPHAAREWRSIGAAPGWRRLP